SGIYLYGGLELQDNNLHMDDNSTYNGIDFYNVDVNCNGIIGETIIGLNYKSISNDLDFACIIGECDGCLDGTDPSDGVVRSDCANLKNYYNLNINQVFNLFYFNSSGTVEIHTDLPMQNYQNMQGLDEPNEYVLAYHIYFDTLYSGFITVQPTGGYPYDYDDFKFSVSEPSKLSISISNINLLDLVARIIDLAGNVVGSIVHSDGGASINFTQELNAGDYFLEIYGVPTSISYLSPYNFKIQKTSVVSVLENSENANKIVVYPNPVKNQLTIDIENSDEILNVEILNPLGQIVYRSTFLNAKTIVNMNQFSEGLYIIKFDSERSHNIRKFVKE
ncbi:MAG: T9SS type A sorting domain-containing protein, partial [Bacteroidetes bacterium]|nr:T9SS type A sorting domain-containing protein [Bacteroidota bacterium]